jgi:hypothetical protein
MLSLVYADTDPVLAYLFQGDDMGLFAVSFASPCMNPCQRELLRNQSSGASERSATTSGATDRLADTASSQSDQRASIGTPKRRYRGCFRRLASRHLTICEDPVAPPVHHRAPRSDPIVGHIQAELLARHNCIRDDRGWHYMRGERRTVCRPDRPRADVKFYGWRCEGPRCGWWHKRDKRWHEG